MKTSIQITGQVSGNRTLLNNINGVDAEIKNLPFNGYLITFSTKKAAKKALWEAFKSLRSDLTDYVASNVRYSKYGSLSYDASRAEILDRK